METALDKQITFLIGKNEQGKTNILKALESINMDYSYEENDLCYNYEVTKEGDKIPMVTLNFELDKGDISKLVNLDSQLVNIKSLKVIKYFDNSFDIFINDKLIDIAATNNDGNIKQLLAKTKDNFMDVIETATSDIRIEKKEIEQNNINYIINSKKADGGFGLEGNDNSRLDTTYYAVAVLDQYNCLNLINKNKLIKFILSVQQNNGGFSFFKRNTPSLEFTCYAIEILNKFNELDEKITAKCLNYIMSNLNEDGGFRTGAHNPSRIDETYYAVRTLNCLGTNAINKDKITRFVLSTESPNGGFGVQSNSPPTTQFTYYALTILDELGALEKTEIDKHIEYILSSEKGGGFINQINGDIDEESTYYAYKLIDKYYIPFYKMHSESIISYISNGQDGEGGFRFNGKERQIKSTYYAIYILKSIEKGIKSLLNQEIKSKILLETENTEDIEKFLGELKDNLIKIINESGLNMDLAKYFTGLDSINPLKDYTKNIKQEILNLLPNMIYFDSIDLIKDSINYYEYINHLDKYKTFTNLFKLCGLNLDDIIKKDVQQRSRIMSKASKAITGLVNESWTQDGVTVNVGIDGDEIHIFIEDTRGAHDPPSKRSDGFQWYLSFYINFMAGTKDEYRNCILLIDNTGLLLHPRAQKDLLKTLERLSDSNQIIFTTHSPYLIDRNKLDSIRIIEKKDKGTSIQEKFHNSDRDSLEPIRAAFGISIGDSLFGSKENIIVEGYSDYCIIEGMAYYLKKRGKTTIDLNKVSIISVGGADKIPLYAHLVWKEDYKYVIILDNDNEGRKIEKVLADKYPIDTSHIIRLLLSGNEGKDATIEDLIDGTFYNKSFNAAYSEQISKVLNKSEVKEEELDQTEKMQVNKYKKFLRDNKLGDIDKILIAKRIRDTAIGRCEGDDLISETTVANFEKLFAKINELIK